MEISTLPKWLQYAQALSQAVGIPLVAGIGAWVAWLQMRVARAKLQHDVFERRWAIYQATLDFLHKALRHEIDKNAFDKYRADIAGYKFLFGTTVAEYLQEVDDLYSEYWVITELRAAPTHPSYKRWLAFSEKRNTGYTSFRPAAVCINYLGHLMDTIDDIFSTDLIVAT